MLSMEQLLCRKEMNCQIVEQILYAFDEVIATEIEALVRSLVVSGSLDLVSSFGRLLSFLARAVLEQQWKD